MGYTHSLAFQTAGHAASELEASWQGLVEKARAIGTYLRGSPGPWRVRVSEDGRWIEVDGAGPDSGDGDDSDDENTCEVLYMSRANLVGEDHSRRCLFCKTARLPYDAAVVAVLLVAKQQFGGAVAFGSDACEPAELEDGIDLVGRVLGDEARAAARQHADELTRR